MANPSKRIGTTWESDLVRLFRLQGLDAERLRQSGANDEGDIVLKIGGIPYVIEAKATKSLDLATAQNEAEREVRNYARARQLTDLPHFAAIHKRRGYATAEGYVVMPVREWLSQVVDL